MGVQRAKPDLVGQKSSSSITDTDRLIQSIYESALDPDQWNQTLESLRQHFNASAINLFGLEMSAFDNPFVYTSNIPADFGLEYREYWHQHDIWVQGAIQKDLMAGGVAAVGRMLVDKREFVASEFFNDCLRGLGVQDVACTTLWDNEPGAPKIVLSFFRGLGGEDFDKSEHERLQDLGQHINRAFKISWKLGNLNREQTLKQTVLDGIRQAGFILDQQQRILQANVPGNEMLRDVNGLLTIRQGRVVGLGSQTSIPLAAAFALADQGVAASVAYRHDRPDGHADSGMARVLPLHEPQVLGLPALNARYLLLIDRPSALDEGALGAFGQLFRLTRSELAVLAELMNDATPDEIAQNLGVRLPTVRTHLRNLREKTGVRRVSELVRLALTAVRSG